MSQRKVNKCLIAGDIAATATVQITDPTAAFYIAEGEVVVANEEKVLITAGDTYSDHNKIMIGVGTADTYEYTEPDGTYVSGARKIIWSEPVCGFHTLKYTGTAADSTATERQATLNFTSATLVPVIGTEYVVRVVYQDILTHPGQFTQSFRVIASSTTVGDLTDAFVTEINKVYPSGRYDSRVSAVNSGGDLVITAKVITGNEGADEIDEYSQVDFEIGLISDNFDATTVVYNTDAHPGNGNPKIVRDIEKHARAFEGVTNLINFPVIKPDMVVDMNTWYDCITIEHDVEYVSADNQYKKEQPLTTQIFLPNGASQQTEVLAWLNPWFASVPREFATLTL